MPDLTSGSGWFGSWPRPAGAAPGLPACGGRPPGCGACGGCGPAGRAGAAVPSAGLPSVPVLPSGGLPPSGVLPARLRLGVPAYAHPLLAPAEWAELARPGVPLDWVVLNVSAGPGACPDPAVREAVAAVRSAGVRLLGYLDTRYGQRPVDELMSEAGSHLGWYRVDGFFLDQVSAGSGPLPYYRSAASALRGMAGGPIVMNPGIHPYPGYADIADQLVTFDGPWSVYRWAQLPDWVDAYPAERFCHFVHGVPVRHVETALRLARWQGAGTVFATDRGGEQPWAGLPSYWERELELLFH